MIKNVAHYNRVDSGSSHKSLEGLPSHPEELIWASQNKLCVWVFAQ